MYIFLNYLGIIATMILSYLSILYWSWQYFFLGLFTFMFWALYIDLMLTKMKVKPYKLFMVPKDHIIE